MVQHETGSHLLANQLWPWDKGMFLPSLIVNYGLWNKETGTITRKGRNAMNGVNSGGGVQGPVQFIKVRVSVDFQSQARTGLRYARD